MIRITHDSRCARTENFGRCANCLDDLALFDTMCIPCTTRYILIDNETPSNARSFLDGFEHQSQNETIADSFASPHSGDEREMFGNIQPDIQTQLNVRARDTMHWWWHDQGDDLSPLYQATYFPHTRLVDADNAWSSMPVPLTTTNGYLQPIRDIEFESDSARWFPEPALDPFAAGSSHPGPWLDSVQIFSYHPALELVPRLSYDPASQSVAGIVSSDLPPSVADCPGQALAAEHSGNLHPEPWAPELGSLLPHHRARSSEGFGLAGRPLVAVHSHQSLWPATALPVAHHQPVAMPATSGVGATSVEMPPHMGPMQRQDDTTSLMYCAHCGGGDCACL